MSHLKNKQLSSQDLVGGFWMFVWFIFTPICIAVMALFIARACHYYKLSKTVSVPENVWKFKDGWWLVDEINTYHVQTNSSEYILIPGTRVRPLTVSEIQNIDLKDRYLSKFSNLLLGIFGLFILYYAIYAIIICNGDSISYGLADCCINSCSRKGKGVD